MIMEYSDMMEYVDVECNICWDTVKHSIPTIKISNVVDVE